LVVKSGLFIFWSIKENESPLLLDELRLVECYDAFKRYRNH
jgi:hypothetical protein